VVAQRVALNTGPPKIFDKQSNPAMHAPTSVARVLTQLHYCTLHFWKLVWPATLCSDYSGPSIPLVHSFGDKRNAGAVVLALVLSGLAWYCTAPLLRRDTDADGDAATRRSQARPRKTLKKAALVGKAPLPQPTPAEVGAAIAGSVEHRARVGVACAMMVAPFLPASGFVMPVGFAVAERIMFLPTIGFSALLVLLLQPWLRAGTRAKRLVAQFVLLLSVALGGRRTLARNPEWSSQETLYVSTLRDYPDNAKVRVHMYVPRPATLTFMHATNTAPTCERARAHRTMLPRLHTTYRSSACTKLRGCTRTSSSSSMR